MTDQSRALRIVPPPTVETYSLPSIHDCAEPLPRVIIYGLITPIAIGVYDAYDMFYIGQTRQDLYDRLRLHRSEHTSAAKNEFTRALFAAGYEPLITPLQVVAPEDADAAEWELIQKHGARVPLLNSDTPVAYHPHGSNAAPQALSILQASGPDGLRYRTWQAACALQGISRNQFGRAVDALRKAGHVVKAPGNYGRYSVAPTPIVSPVPAPMVPSAV